MGILAIVFALAVTIVLLPSARPGVPQLAAGIEALWRPGVFLLFQALRGLVFIMLGKSLVTGAPDILSSPRRPNLVFDQTTLFEAIENRTVRT
jgi:hypothetical protein